MTLMGPMPSPQVEITFADVEGTTARDAARNIMVSMEADPAVLDPVVSISAEDSLLTLSFELVQAPGDLRTDLIRGLEAVDRALSAGVPSDVASRPLHFEVRAALSR